MLEQVYPEGLQSMERTHVRTNLRERSGREVLLQADHNHSLPVSLCHLEWEVEKLGMKDSS